MTIKPALVFSDLPIPPGEALSEELAARGITRQELADALGCGWREIGEIIRGEQAITPDIATGICGVLDGIDADFWTGLESRYRLALARQREHNTERYGAIAEMQGYRGEHGDGDT